MKLFTTMRATCMGHGLNKWRTINSFVHKVRLDNRRARERLHSFCNKTKISLAGCTILRDLPSVWPLLACPRARRPEKWEDDTHIDRLGEGAVSGHLFKFHFCFVLYITYSDLL